MIEFQDTINVPAASAIIFELVQISIMDAICLNAELANCNELVIHIYTDVHIGFKNGVKT